jgi:energy-coupling factor transport system ATP-binding protein
MSYDIITLTDVAVKNLEKEILDRVDFNLCKGKIAALIGISGSGKTTLLKLILDLLFEEHGWLVTGNIVRFPGLRMAYINQNPSLQVFKNYVYEEFTTRTKSEVQILLQKVNCSSLLEKRSLELSQGEKTIVALLKALSYSVSLIVLDEIMINLSANKKLLVEKLLLDFKMSGGTLVIADHDKSILDFSDQIFLIDKGSITPTDKQSALTFLSDDLNPTFKCSQEKINDETTTLEVTQISNAFIIGSIHTPISFRANNGDIIGITGDNGSGKSTLLEILAGIKKAKRGTIKWSEKELKNLRARKSIFAITTEESSHQFYTEKVSTELDIACADKTALATKTIFDFFQIELLANRKIDELSYGEKQRLAIVISMISNAKVLLFDEPTYGMDKKTRRAFISGVRFLANHGNIIVIASHETALLSHLTEKIINL